MSLEKTEGNFREILKKTAEGLTASGTPEFKKAGHHVVLLKPDADEHGEELPGSARKLREEADSLISNGKAVTAFRTADTGLLEAVLLMSVNTETGFEFSCGLGRQDLLECTRNACLLELADGVYASDILCASCRLHTGEHTSGGCGMGTQRMYAGKTTDDGCYTFLKEKISREEI